MNMPRNRYTQFQTLHLYTITCKFQPKKKKSPQSETIYTPGSCSWKLKDHLLYPWDSPLLNSILLAQVAFVPSSASMWKAQGSPEAFKPNGFVTEISFWGTQPSWSSDHPWWHTIKWRRKVCNEDAGLPAAALGTGDLTAELTTWTTAAWFTSR